MFFVGQLGPSAIAAVGMSGVLIGIIMIAVMGISTGTIAVISRYIGMKDEEYANIALAQSIFLALIFSVFVTVFLYVFSEQILQLLGAEPEVCFQGEEYLKVMALGSPTIFLTVMMFSALRGQGIPYLQ
jgi:Na+-driven multidrug efflux pump